MEYIVIQLQERRFLLRSSAGPPGENSKKTLEESTGVKGFHVHGYFWNTLRHKCFFVFLQNVKPAKLSSRLCAPWGGWGSLPCTITMSRHGSKTFRIQIVPVRFGCVAFVSFVRMWIAFVSCRCLGVIYSNNLLPQLLPRRLFEASMQHQKRSA